MLPQSIQTFLRTLMRDKSLTAINLVGLSLGFSTCILIALFLFDELSYDSYHVNLKRIYRINTRFVSEGSVDHIAISATPLPEFLTQNYPEVEASVRFDHRGMGTVIRNQSRIFRENNAYHTDPDVFKIFSYKFIQGDPATALSGPYKAVLTRSQALKIFEQVDVLGRTFTTDQHTYTVTGVIEDVPENSDIRFSMLMSFNDETSKTDWFDFSYYVFVMFKSESLNDPGFLPSFERKLQAIADEKINAAIKEENADMSATMHIQPLEGLHFDNTLMYDTPKGNKNYVYIFACVAGLILFIACINYINFSIVQSMEKAREVGIRKVVGSSFYQIVTRYITQSFLLALVSAVIAFALVILLLPFFNEVVGRNFRIADLFRWDVLTAIATILVVTGVLAGSYPAFYGASVNIISALKGHVASPGGRIIRKVSITLQLAVSLGLIMATVVIFTQMEFIRTYDPGFNKENVIAISTPEDSASFAAISDFKNELRSRNDLVRSVSIVGDGGMPGDPQDEKRGSVTIKNGRGEDEDRMINCTLVDAEYFSTLSIPVKRGRSFENGSVYDIENSVMVNEALVTALGWDDPLAQTINWGEKERPVIGVVGNVHYKSLHDRVQPQIYISHQNQIVNVMIALKPDAIPKLDELKLLWQKHMPTEPFAYRYLDETLYAQYKQEQTVSRISSYFSILTVLISLLGLFGVSLLSAYQRRREIGIRKIVGAKFVDIAKIFYSEYFLLLTVTIMIISPLTWYIMERWLTMFINHAPLEVMVFVLVGCMFFLMTLLTIMISIGRIASVKNTELIRTDV